MQKTIFDLYKNRDVRIFLSSTFKDMMVEREFLVKRTFPELRKKFAERGVTITEIDLRWGVLEEEAENGKVIDICLTEIDKSRPYFIGILGARYGWIPDKTEYQKHKKIIEDFSWVAQDIESDLSITEMEIQYGVLRNPEMIKRSAFYFRDNKNKNSISFKENADSVEEKKLNILKSKIKDNNDLVSDKFNNVEELGAGITDFLTKIIENDFPVLDKKTKKILPQLNFINSNRKAYIREEKYFKLITEHIERTSSPIVITGKPGAGASSLLSNYLVGYAEQYPNDVLLYNFSNASDDSSNHIEVLKRFCEELSGKEINLQKESPKNTSEQLKNYLEDLITERSPQKILIVIDGLDEFDNIESSLLLNWLPDNIDFNAKVIFSCGAGESLERLKKRRFELLYISKTEKEAKEEFINKYLLEYSKKLPSKYIDIIVRDDISELPLILKSFIDELRQFGLHEELNKQIEYYISATGPVEFYERLLQRLENDFNKNRKGLIKDVFTLLYTSKSGLTEKEILAILDIPPLYWAPVYNTIESNLLNMNGKLSIAHKYLNEAVKKRYITLPENQKVISKKIINYFNKYISDSRAFQEVAHQLILLNDKKGLFNLLSDLETIFNFFHSSENENLLLQYWSKIFPEYSPESVYTVKLLTDYIIDKEYNFSEIITVTTVFGLLFENLGVYNIAERYYETIYNLVNDKLDESDDLIRSSLARLVGISLDLNKIDKAEKYALKAVALSEKYPANNNDNFIWAYSNLASVLSAKEEYAKEIEIYNKLISIIDDDKTKTVKDKLNIMGELAMAYFSSNLIDDSISLYKKIIKIKEELYGNQAITTITTLYKLAFVYSEIGKYKEAHEYFEKSIIVSRETYGESHPDTIKVLLHFVELLFSEANIELAEKYLTKIEKLVNNEKYAGDDLATLIHLQAQLSSEKAEHKKAVEQETDALKLFEKTLGFNHMKTINSMLSLSAYYLQVNRDVDLEKLLKKTEQILLNKFGEKNINLAEIYTLYAGLYRNTDNLKLSLEYARKSMDLRIEIIGESHKNTIKSIQNYSAILISDKQYEEAQKFIEYNLNISEASFGKDSIIYCDNLGLMNEILFAQKENDTLESNLLHIYEFFEKNYGQNHELTCNTLIRLINVKRELGLKDQVLSLIPKATKIAENIWTEDIINYQNWIFDSALVYSGYGEYDKAIEIFNKIYEIQKKHFGIYSTPILLTLSEIAKVKGLKSDFVGAEESYKELYKLIVENKVEYSPEVLSCIHKYALFKHELGEIEEAEKLYQNTLELAIQNFAYTSPITLDHLFYFAGFYGKIGKPEKAETLYREYLDNLNSQDEETEKTILEVLRLLGQLIIPQNRQDKMEVILLKQAGLSEKIYGINSVNTIRVLLNLSATYQLIKDYEKSVAILNRIAAECSSEILYSLGKEYIKMYEGLVSFYNDVDKKNEEPKDNNWEEKVKQNKELIEQFADQQVSREILDLYIENIDLYLTNLGVDHIDSVRCRLDYANKLIEINQFEFANKILKEEVLEILKKAVGINDIEYILALYSLAKTQKGLNKLDEALASFKKVKDQAEIILDAENSFLYEINKKIADTYFAMYKNEEAFNIYNNLFEIVPKDNEFERIYLIYQTGQLFLRIEMYDEAIKNIKEAEVFYEGYYKEKNQYSVEIPNLLAFIYWKKEDLDAATKFYTLAVENAKKIYPNNHRLYVNAVRIFAFFLFNNNRFSESLPYHIELLDIYLGAHSNNDKVVVEQKLNLSTIYQNLEMHKEAIKFLEEAIQAEPEILSENSQKMMKNLYDFYSADD